MMQFVAEKNGWTKFVSMQNQYNLLYREEEREMNIFCNLTGDLLAPVLHQSNCKIYSSPSPPLDKANCIGSAWTQTSSSHSSPRRIASWRTTLGVSVRLG